MDYHVTPTHYLRVDGMCVPGDKSISHRVAILASIAEGTSIIRGFLMGDDNIATLKAMRALGVSIMYHDADDRLLIQGVGLYGLSRSKHPLDLGNSGTGIRLLAGLLSGQRFTSVLTGDASLCTRPMKRIVDPLRDMGADIIAKENKAPLVIQPSSLLKGMTYELPMPSAQVKSSVLLAGLYAEGKTIVIEKIPTRDHTERLLQQFGYSVECHNHHVILQGHYALKATDMLIPGDLSSAAFLLVAALITPGSQIQLQHVGVNPTRMGVVRLLRRMGAHIDIDAIQNRDGEPRATIRAYYSQLSGIEIPKEEVSLSIDEFPILFIAAACAQGTTVLRHATELRVKESDRIAVMAEGLQRLGIVVHVFEDGISIEGGLLYGGEVNSYGDHRVAMAFAIAGNVAEQPILVRDCHHVQTSFPGFVQFVHDVGMRIKVI